MNKPKTELQQLLQDVGFKPAATAEDLDTLAATPEAKQLTDDQQ